MKNEILEIVRFGDGGYGLRKTRAYSQDDTIFLFGFFISKEKGIVAFEEKDRLPHPRTKYTLSEINKMYECVINEKHRNSDFGIPVGLEIPCEPQNEIIQESNIIREALEEIKIFERPSVKTSKALIIELSGVRRKLSAISEYLLHTHKDDHRIMMVRDEIEKLIN